MLEFIQSINYIHWFILGLALLIIEIFIFSNILLWLALAAMIIGFLSISLISSFSFVAFSLFIILTIILSIISDCLPPKTIDDKINKKAQQYIGKSFTIVAVTENGGNIKIGKALWQVKGCEISIGQEVTITDIEGLTFIVKAKN